MVDLRGQILHMRKVSKKLMFIDIEVTGETNENTRESLIFKFWEVPELYDLINRGSDKLHVGDIVTFFGAWDDTAFSVSQYTIMVPWSSVSEGLAFTPVPPATVSTTKRKVSAEALCKFFCKHGPLRRGQLPVQAHGPLGSQASARRVCSRAERPPTLGARGKL